MSLINLNQQYENVEFTDIIDETTDYNNSNFISKVVLYNDNYHTFDQVINQLQKAIACPRVVGIFMAHTVHNEGKCDVFRGDVQRSIRVSDILREINLKTQIVM